MSQLYPPIKPYATDTLSVSPLHTICYEESGNRDGQPAVFLHGGPGVGILPDYRRFFDPEFYRLILPDQRGAGRSTPAAELEENSTWEIVDDLEKLRCHLGIEKWVVMGGSWGSTLALSYAIRYPESVLGLIIRGIFLARPAEILWLYEAGGASEIYPDAWERFISPLSDPGNGGTLESYYTLLTSEETSVRLEAARCWAGWEASIMTLMPNPDAVKEMTSGDSALNIARIECHFALNNFFMPTDKYLLENVHLIKDIPLRIVQGRYDVICPTRSAWDLHKAVPHSELRIVPDGAHSPMDEGMADALVEGSEDFKKLV